jgi:hypothetical protein
MALIKSLSPALYTQNKTKWPPSSQDAVKMFYCDFVVNLVLGMSSLVHDIPVNCGYVQYGSYQKGA